MLLCHYCTATFGDGIVNRGVFRLASSACNSRALFVLLFCALMMSFCILCVRQYVLLVVYPVFSVPTCAG